MKKILTITAIIALLAVGMNFLLDMITGRAVTKAYFEERITDVENKVDSLNVRVGIIDRKVDRLQQETDTIKNVARDNGRKLDGIKAELDEVKSTTQNIQFRLF